MSGRAIFVPKGETGISGTVHRCFSVCLRFIRASEKSHLVKEGKMLCNSWMRRRERPALQGGAGSGNVGLLAGYSASTYGASWSTTKEAKRALSLP